MVTIVAARGESELLADVPVAELPHMLADPYCVVWVDLSGPQDDVSTQIVSEIFRFHPLAIEDCFEAREVPRVQAFDGYLYLITHGLSSGSTAEEAEVIELDVFLGKRFLVTYHLKTSRSVAAVQAVLRRNAGLLHKGPVSLLHALLDQQVDGIEPVLDSIEGRLEGLEAWVFTQATNTELATLLAMRRTTLQLRRWMSKQREVMLRLSRNEHGFVTPHEAILFRDVYDHLARFTDLVESFREMTTSIQEAYLSVTNNRLGEIMKFLTLYTAILMPLTVITGIYGMNFQHMPELASKYAYPAVLAVMALTATGVALFFKKRGWLGAPARRKRVL